MLRVKINKQMSGFNINLDIEIKSAFTALFGASGSGKTTTLNLIAGLMAPTQGEIALNDRILFSKKEKINIAPQKRHIGYIFQESRLFPHLSVKKNLEFGWHKIAGKNRKFRFEEIVQVTGVNHLLNRMPRDLSGGEKQRVALARALLASPDYLLMDEPLAALDLPARLSFLKFLKTIHNELHLPILYVSHDLSNVLNFADRVIILQNGRNIGYGPPYTLLDKMTAPPLISREDIPNIFEVEIVAHHASKGLTMVEVENLTFVLPHLERAVGEKVLLNIPASEIIIAKEEPRGLSASNIFAGTITDIYHLGARILVAVNAGEHFTVEIVPATVERLDLRKHAKVFLIIKASSFRRLG
ncbi:MAG: molybdenum ABC transporter ATP-binding protein [bacterium]